MSINWRVDNRKEKEISIDITTQKFKMTFWIYDIFKKDKISFMIQTHLISYYWGREIKQERIERNILDQFTV